MKWHYIFLVLFSFSHAYADPFPITREWFGMDGAGHPQAVNELYTIGIRHFGINGKSTTWQTIQKKEDGPYNFLWMDEVIMNITDNLKHQDVKLEFGVRCNAPWATGVKKPKGVSNYMPKGAYPDGKYWQAWYKFVYTLVERYDGDGKDDLPGLKQNLLYNLHLEDEMDTHWKKYTPEQFGQLMEITYKAIKDACPDVLVMRSATNLVMLLDDDLDFEGIIARMEGSKADPLIRYSIEKGYDYFDAFGLHPNYHYTGVKAQARYVNGLCDLYNKPRKPIIASDMNSTLHSFGNRPRPGSDWKRLFPDLQPDVDNSGIDDPVEVIQGKNPGEKYDPVKTKQGFQADQANQIIKKLALGMTVPYEQMFMSQVVDWPKYFIPFWKFGGFFDKELLEKTEDNVHAPGVIKPVFWAVKFWMDEFVGTTAAQVIHKDIENNYASWCTYVIRLDHPAGTKYVAWSDKPKGDVYTLEVSSESMMVFPNITAPGQKEPEGSSLPVKDGKLILKLDKTPQLITKQRVPPSVPIMDQPPKMLKEIVDE